MWEIAVYLAVAGGVYDGVFLCCLFPTRCLGWDLGLNWVSFGGFAYIHLNELIKISCLRNLRLCWKSLFVQSLKIFWRMTYTVCHAPLLMTSHICYSNNNKVILISKWCHQSVILSINSYTVVNSIVAMVTDLWSHLTTYSRTVCHATSKL